MQPVYRFAPSPNGELHLGHACSALLSYDRCRSAGGRFLLRIEDIDPIRCRPEYEVLIEEDLAWLGLTWERPVRRQSEHFGEYRGALRRLDSMGLLYPAFMTRGEVAAVGGTARDPDGALLYPPADRALPREEAERRITAGAPYSLRIHIDRAMKIAGPLTWLEVDEGHVAADPAAWGDFIVARKDVPTSYHLAVVVDDAAQGVTHVVRGRDLYPATAAHVLLQKLLSLPSPIYCHHRLVTDATGRKLSKSDHDTSLRVLRESGVTPADIRRMTGVNSISPA